MSPESGLDDPGSNNKVFGVCLCLAGMWGLASGSVSLWPHA